MPQPRLEKRLTHIAEVELPSWSNWVGAISFGKRSCASLQVLASVGHRVVSGDLVTYTNKTGGETRAATNKSRNRDVILDLLSEMGDPPVVEHQISQYAATPLAHILSKACSTAATHGGRTILDVTGLTKFHTVIAAAEAAVRRFEGLLTLAYSIPENYIGFEKKERYTSGFGETLILPLVDGAKMMLESRARGVVLPGHEGQRLLVALGEIDPVAGTFIHAVTPGRPDFEQVTRHRNRAVYNDLTRLGRWRDHSVEFHRMRTISSLVRTEVRRAKASKGPLLIYPFGPKPVIFAAVFTAARLYPEGSWFVYPVPTTSSNQHTEGVADTFWMHL